MAFTYRSDLARLLEPGEVDANFQEVESLYKNAQAFSRLYANTTDGLAGTSDGQYFGVRIDDTTVELFLNDAGSAVSHGTTTTQIGAHAAETETHGAPVGERVANTGDLGTMAAQSYAAAPFRNILADGGRFDGSAGGFNLLTPGPYANNSGWFGSYNGSTFSEAGKFIHNNNNFGGSEGRMPRTVEGLLAAMGRTGNDARYGVEFYVSQVTAGSGTGAATTFPSGTKYLLLYNSGAVFSSDGTATWCGWVRATGASLGLKAPNSYVIERSVDGIPVDPPTQYELSVTDGWVFYKLVCKQVRGYDNPFPYFYSTSGNGAQIACPVVAPGYVETEQHASPLCSITETV